jgi:hypothetical protein
VVLVATEADMLYGVSAASGAVLWSDALYNLDNSNLGSVSAPYKGCRDIGTQIGVTSTPVIDPQTGIAYVVGAVTVGGVPEYRTFAVQAATGQVAPGWTGAGVQIQGTAINSNPTHPTNFVADHETQRTGLVSVNGVVYAGFSAQCDYLPFQGWMVGVSTTTQSVTSLWSSAVADSTGLTLNGGGVWQSGGAPVDDASGNLFFTTGNAKLLTYPTGPVNAQGPPLTTYSEAVVKLQTTGGILTATDWYIPGNALRLDRGDADVSSGGPVMLPPSMSSPRFPQVIVQLGKFGRLDALNMTNMGGFNMGPGGTNAVLSEAVATGGAWSHPAIWPGDGGYVYATVTGGSNVQFGAMPGNLDAFHESCSSTGAPTFTLEAHTSALASGVMNWGSSSPLVTSMGTTSGSALVWVEQFPTGPSGIATLEAYSALPTNPGGNGSLLLVWQSPTPFNGEKLSEPGVGDNMLFVGTRDGQLIGYGLTAPPTVTANDVDFGSTQVGASSTRYAEVRSLASTSVTSFTVSGSSFRVGANAPTLPYSLTSGHDLAIPLTFSPHAGGTNTGQLTINTTTGPLTINLTGLQSSSTNFSLTSGVANFGLLSIEGGSRSKVVTIKNISRSSATIFNLDTSDLSGVYSLSSVPASQTLRSQGSYSFVVTFRPPGTSGNFANQFPSLLTVRTSIGNVGVPILAIAAPPPSLLVAETALDFGAVKVGHLVTRSFHLLNTGGMPFVVTRVSNPSTPYAIGQRFKAGSALPVNASITVVVQFRPTRVGRFTTTFALSGNDHAGAHRITFTGSSS